MLCGLIGYPKTLFLLFFLTNYTQWIPAASVDLMCQPGIVTKPTSVRSISKYSGMTKCFVKLDTCIVFVCVCVCVCVCERLLLIRMLRFVESIRFPRTAGTPN